MNPDYEFLTHQWKQMVSQPRLSLAIEKDRNRKSGIRGKLFYRMGDVMISGGIWLKKNPNLNIMVAPWQSNHETNYEEFINANFT